MSAICAYFASGPEQRLQSCLSRPTNYHLHFGVEGTPNNFFCPPAKIHSRVTQVAPYAAAATGNHGATLVTTASELNDVGGGRKWYLVYPDQRLHKSWRGLKVIAILSMAFLVPLRVSFHEADDQGVERGLKTVELIWDIIFFADTVISFLTAYVETEQFQPRIVDDLREISRRYLNSRYFYVDALSAIPADTIINSRGILGYEQLPSLDLFRIVQMIKLYHMSEFFQRLEAQYNLNQGLLRMISILYMIGIVTHCVGCTWVTIGVALSDHPEDCEVHYRCTSGSLSLEDPDDICSTHEYTAQFSHPSCTWIFREGYFERPQTNTYSASIYWAFSTLTTVGYGDISATNAREQVFSMFIMLLGVSWYAYIVSAMSTIVAGFEGQRRVIRDRIAAVNRFAVDFELSTDLKRRVRKYYEYVYTTQHRWQEKDSYNAEEILAGLNSQLRLDVILFVERHLIGKIPFLADKPSQCKADFVSSVRPVIVPEGDYIIFEGSTAKEMYFLMQGQVGVFYGKKLVNSLTAPAYFGEVGCVKGGIRTASIAALTTCELQVLPQSKLVELIRSYPEVRKEIMMRDVVRNFKMAIAKKPNNQGSAESSAKPSIRTGVKSDPLEAQKKLTEKVNALAARLETLVVTLDNLLTQGSVAASKTVETRPSEDRLEDVIHGFNEAESETERHPSEGRPDDLLLGLKSESSTQTRPSESCLEDVVGTVETPELKSRPD